MIKYILLACLSFSVSANDKRDSEYFYAEYHKESNTIIVKTYDDENAVSYSYSDTSENVTKVSKQQFEEIYEKYFKNY